MIALFRHDITILQFPAFNTQTFHDVIPLKPMDTTPRRAMLIVNPVSGTRDKAALPDIVPTMENNATKSIRSFFICRWVLLFRD